jgi:predicted DNA-binding protein
MATNKTRLSVPMKTEVFEKLKAIAEQQGLSMSTIAMQMITTNVNHYEHVYNTLNELMKDPHKLAEFQKLIGEANIND